MQQKPMNKREKNTPRDHSKIKPKFQEERMEAVKANPLKPLNGKQKYYMEILESKSVVIATGFAGTSKSYIPTVMASDKFKLGQIDKIIFTRPAISSSKSLGFFSGDAVEKLTVWLGPVISILKERLGNAAYDIALHNSDISFIPLETIKGMSLNNCWLIVEEASDLTKDEIVKIVTRMGKNSTLVLAGDIRQSELKGDSGLVWLSSFVKRNETTLGENFGWVDFNETSDIVRSDAVKRFIVALVKEEKIK